MLSTSAIFVKLSAEAPSIAIVFYRLFFTTVVLLPFALMSSSRRSELSKITKKQLAFVCGAGALLALHYFLWFESLRYTSTASSTVIVCCQPIYAILIDKFLAKRQVRRHQIIGIVVSLVGCVLISAHDFQISGIAFVGDMIAVAAGSVVSFYYYIGEKARAEMSAVNYSVLTFGATTIISFVLVLASGSQFFGFAANTWAALLGLAIISTIGGQFIFNVLLKDLPASSISMSVLMEPVFTIIQAFFIFSEALTFEQTIGIFVIFSGMFVYFKQPKANSAE